MANHLMNIIAKELREIFRDPRLFIGMIIVPLLMFPLMGGAVRVSVDAAEKELQKINVGVLNMDTKDGNSTLSDVLCSLISSSKVTITNVSAESENDGIRLCVEKGIGTMLVLPMNFTEKIIAGEAARVTIYSVLKRFDISEGIGSQRLLSIIESFNSMITADRLLRQYPNSDPADIIEPVRPVSQSIIRGQVVKTNPETVITSMMSSGLMMPIVIMLLIIMAGQLAATSVAMEKEQKTLEVLLTLPIKRVYILIGKIAGVVVVSVIATLAYIAGFTYYMGSFSFGTDQGTDLSAYGLTPNAAGYGLLAISLFLSFLAALSLAVMIAAFTKDVRSAQSLMGIIYIPILIPAFLLMMSPIEILPAGIQAVLYAIPFTYPTLAAKALYTYEYTMVALGIVYQLTFTAIVLALAAKLYDSERLLTAKLEFGKKKTKEREEP